MIAEVKNATFNKEISTGFTIPNEGIFCEVIDAYLQKQGVRGKWVQSFRKKLINDWNTCELPVEKKIWALENGFMPSSVLLYGLTDDNIKLYLSDLDYIKIHPLNNHFAFWINDKITLKNIFATPIRSISRPGVTYNLMPDYYLYIENDGHFSYLMDSPQHIPHDENYLLNLLKQKKILALKPSNGGGGFGFVKLEMIDDAITWNDSQISEAQLKDNQKSLNGYVVTEFLKQHKDFDSICDKSACTLRVLVVKNIDDVYDGGILDIVASYARFGTEASEGACNMHAGAVAISYDSETGAYGDFFFRYKGFADKDQTRFDKHPDSNVTLKGKTLPKHEEVKDVVLSACSYLSSLEYFGVDVVITDDSVKILEINTLPAMSTPQVLTGPMFSIPAARAFFNRKLNLLKTK